MCSSLADVWMSRPGKLRPTCWVKNSATAAGSLIRAWVSERVAKVSRLGHLDRACRIITSHAEACEIPPYLGGATTHWGGHRTCVSTPAAPPLQLEQPPPTPRSCLGGMHATTCGCGSGSGTGCGRSRAATGHGWWAGGRAAAEASPGGACTNSTSIGGSTAAAWSGCSATQPATSRCNAPSELASTCSRMSG